MITSGEHSDFKELSVTPSKDLVRRRVEYAVDTAIEMRQDHSEYVQRPRPSALKVEEYHHRIWRPHGEENDHDYHHGTKQPSVRIFDTLPRIGAVAILSGNSFYVSFDGASVHEDTRVAENHGDEGN